MDSFEFDKMYLTCIKELVEKQSNETTNAILADTYLRLVKSLHTCCSENTEIDPMVVISLGSLAYHFHNQKEHKDTHV